MKQAFVRFMLRVRLAFDRAGIEPPAWLLRLGRALYFRWAPPPAPPAAPAVSLPPPGQWPELAGLQAQLVQANDRLDQLVAHVERLEATLYLMRLQNPEKQ